jgi:hypothetical protein
LPIRRSLKSEGAAKYWPDLSETPTRRCDSKSTLTLRSGSHSVGSVGSVGHRCGHSVANAGRLSALTCHNYGVREHGSSHPISGRTSPAPAARQAQALSLAAGQHLTTPTEWARQALLRSLQAEGIRICDGKAAVGERGDTAAPGSLHRGQQA